MSDAESRILPWPGPGGPRPPPGSWGPQWPMGRPPAGAWPPGPLPPGPGPFPQPPDVFSAFAWLAKNYREAQAAKEFLKLLIQDMIAEDPTFLANAHATVGVTDGSAAQPGMVGEFIRLAQPVPYPASATGQAQTLSMGVLPPGDWDVQAYSGFSTEVGTAVLISDPVPAGFSDALVGGIAGVTGEGLVVVTNTVRALLTVPTLIVFVLTTSATAAGEAGPIVTARRRR